MPSTHLRFAGLLGTTLSCGSAKPLVLPIQRGAPHLQIQQIPSQTLQTTETSRSVYTLGNLAAVAPLLILNSAAAAADESYASSLPIQLDTPFGPVAGTPQMFLLPALSVLSAIGTLAFAAATGGQPVVYRDTAAATSPFGRSVDETVDALRRGISNDQEGNITYNSGEE